MTIERVSKNYEILVRFNEDGQIGAHLVTLTGFAEDGVFLQAPQVDLPQELTCEQLKDLVSKINPKDWYVPPVTEE